MKKMYNRLLKSRILGLILISAMAVSCSKAPTPTVTTAAASNILLIAGGAVSLPAQDLPIVLKSQEILDDSDTPVVDGTLFIVTGNDNIPVSLDGITFSNSIKVPSKKAIITFSARPSTIAGTYKVQVTQNQKQSRNATGTFYVDVTPALADDLGQIKTNRMETIPQPTIRYSALADGTSTAQVSVGPIIDKYGNALRSGFVRLVTDKGQITSLNPSTISDGYVFFSFIPTTQESTVNVKAQAVDEAAAVIIKEQIGTIYQVKPKLQFSADEDLGNFLLGQTASISATLKNNGSTVANNVQFSTDLPFSVPAIGTQCPKTLEVGQSCSFTIQANSTQRSNIVGAIVAKSDPSNIPEAKATLGLTARAVDPAHLSVSNGSLIFNSVCAKTVDQIINVQNNGELDATNFSVIDTYPMNQDTELACNASGSAASCSSNSLCRWTSSNICTSKAFDIIIPPADTIIAGPTANCGTTIPAGGINCRLIVRFYPMSLYSNYQTSFRIQADSVAPVAVNLNASSGIGDPAVQIPISFAKTEIGLSTSDFSGITLGPVVDQCGNRLNNISTFRASVTAGSLNSTTGAFADGGALLNWNGSDQISDMGNQTFTVTAGLITNNAILPFTGVKISLASNSTNIAEVNADAPDYKIWNVQNTGNKQTSISNISFSNLKNVTVSSYDLTGCSILPANGTCQIKVLFQPQITSDPNSVQFSGNLTVNSPSRGKNSDSIEFLGFGSKTISVGNNDSQYYYLGKYPAGVGVSKVITIKNNSASALSAMNFTITGSTTNWSYAPLTCGVTLNPGQSCTFKMQYSSADQVSGLKQTTLRISSGVRYSDINFAIDLVGDINNINPTIPMAATLSAIPADGTSTTIVTAGLVKDLLNNQISEGTAIYFSTSKGSIVESQPMYLGADGKAKVTVRSSNNEVGNGSVRADIKNSAGSVVSSGFYTVSFTGVYLTFDGVVGPIDFGSVPLGQFKDVHFTLKNTGTANANNLNITTNDITNFSIADLGTCSVGSLGAGQSCDIVVRYNSLSLAGSAGVSAVLTASSSELTGKNSVSANLHAVSLLPATLAATTKTLAIPLQQNTIYATQVTLTNIGADTLRNFTISSNKPDKIGLSSYDGCNNLVGGASCQFTLTFNANGVTSLFSSIITAAGDNTAIQINFIADLMSLAFVNPNFTADAFTCQPIQVQAQDSNGNAMVAQSSLTLAIASNKLGSFYSNRACSGTTLSKTTISQGGTSSPQIYFQPKIAGKHLLTVSSDSMSGTQENLANLVISPGKVLTASPMQPVPFIALGAQGDVHCTFVLNSSGSNNTIPAVGKACNYKVGNLGSVVDRIILTDSDTPPNTAALQVTVGPPVSISPTVMTVNSGQQIQFSASNGSGVGYVYSTTPNNLYKIGSSVYSNIYTAGQNVSGVDDLVETVTVTDSYGASATALVKVKKSIFTQQQVVSAPTTGSKSVAMWGNYMLVGDPAAASLTAVSGAGAIHIYKKNSDIADKTTWTFQSTIYSPNIEANGSFGQSLAMWNNQVVVGAPKESGTVDAAQSGVIYHFTMDASGVPGPMTRIFSDYQKRLKANAHFGELVSITQKFLVGYNSDSLGVSIYDYTNFTQAGSQCKRNNAYPCPELEFSSNGIARSISIYNDDNYGGAYLALGIPESSLGSPRLTNSGSVRVYRRTYNSIDGADWRTNSSQPVLPESVDNISAGALLGTSVSMYGPYLVVGAPGYNNGTGRVLVFRRDPNVADNNTWSVEHILKPEVYNPYVPQGAGFGKTLAHFGNYILVGAQNETNYPGLSNSGSAYVFQRYLSENNRWEFLGQLRSTDYTAGNNFSTSMAAYTNDFAVASFNNNTGYVYTFNGRKSLNKWPFGFHGNLTLSSDYDQTAGTMRDWSSLIIPAQYRYKIGSLLNVSNQYSYIGVAGDTVLNGVIQANGSRSNGDLIGNKPDESGFTLSDTETYSVLQSAGGAGGTGASGFTAANLTNCGNSPICQIGSPNLASSPLGSAGTGQNDGDGGNGGNGGNASINKDWLLANVCPHGNGGEDRCNDKYSCSLAAADSSVIPTGGKGGDKGGNGRALSVKVMGQISGSGIIDVSGQNGNNGELGVAGSYAAGQCQQNDADYWGNGFCSNGDVGNCTRLNMGSQSGTAGGGGGGSGGTAGYVSIETNDGTTLSPFNIFLGAGNGGTAGNGAQSGYRGIFGCYSINGKLSCGDLVLKDASDVNFIPGKTYLLSPSGGALNLYNLTDGNALVQNNVGYYFDNGNSINSTCVWKFSTVSIPAGVTIKIDPACKWTQILAKNGFILNGLILANNISDGYTNTYYTQEMAFNGQFLSSAYQANQFQANGGPGGISYENTNTDYFSSNAQPSYNYVNYAGSQGNGNGGGGSGMFTAYSSISPTTDLRNGISNLSGDAALNSTALCNQRRSTLGAPGVNGNACQSISSVGDRFPGGGGFRGGHGQNIFIKSPTGIIGNGTINLSGSNGGPGGSSYSYTGGGIVCASNCTATRGCLNACNYAKNYTGNTSSSQTPSSLAIVGGGGGGAGGSGGTIILKTPSNPANINFILNKGLGGAAGGSVVTSNNTVYEDTEFGYTNNQKDSSYNDGNTAGHGGADGANGVYRFLPTTEFK
jgi:hypothetical protein